MTPKQHAQRQYLIIKPDGHYLTTAPTLGDARRIARDYWNQYGRYGWRFVRVAS